jgi:adenylate cyclase
MSTLDWMLSRESRLLAFDDFLLSLIERLRAEGLALWRVSTSLRTFHPEVFVYNFQWRLGKALESILQPRQLMDSPIYRKSPVYALHHLGIDEIRVNLQASPETLEYDVCRELAAEGGRDYFLTSLDYSDGQRSFISFTTDSDSGFSEQNLVLIRSLIPALALRNELAAQRFLTDCLLRVYLGDIAAQRVQGGQFLRGHSDTLEAVIWFADLRDFTSLSNRVSPQRLVQILDQYFDALVGPIQTQGGEVLKFIGDAVLAIFLTTHQTQQACLSALSAAEEVLKNIGALKIPEVPELAVGIGLHFGELTFGNVGSMGRLDFTVIGAQVNEASRIEGMCKTLEKSLLMSEAFVRASGRTDFYDLGYHDLRGIEQPVRIYAHSQPRKADAC